MKKPIRIGVILQSNKNWMGGVIYTKNLVKTLLKQARDESPIEICLITASDPKQSLQNGSELCTGDIILTSSIRTSFFNRLRWKIGKLFPQLRDSRLVKIVNKRRIDFLYPITGDSEISWDFECDWAAWIPDFQHKYLPQFFSKKEIKSRDHSFNRISNEAKKVAFSSQVALDDFKKFYPNSAVLTYVLRFSSFPDPTWYQQDPAQVQLQYNLPEKYFLVCNQFWKHKNHKIIVDALIVLKNKGIEPIIVCTGALVDTRFPEYVTELIGYIHEHSLESQFVFLGLIPRNDQIQLMRRALCIIQPSLFEGWSTVVEDARLLGKTIILSDIPVHQEQAPLHGLFFQHLSHKDLSEKIIYTMNVLCPGPNLLLEEESRQSSLLQSRSYAESFYNMVLDKNL